MKTYAFIDSQNLKLGVRSLGWKLGFARFRKYLEDKYKVEKVIFELEKIIKTLDLTNKFQTVRYIITKVIVKGGQLCELRVGFPYSP